MDNIKDYVELVKEPWGRMFYDLLFKQLNIPQSPKLNMRSLGHKMIMISTQVDEEGQHFYRKLGYKDMGAIVMDIPPYEQPLEMFMGKAL